MNESFHERAHESKGKETPLLCTGWCQGRSVYSGPCQRCPAPLWGGVSTGPALPVALASTWHLFLALKIHPERTFFFPCATNLSSWPHSRTL